MQVSAKLDDLKHEESHSEDEPNYEHPYYYSPLDFDPKKPDNKKKIVKLIEDKEKEIKTFLDNIKETDKNLLEYDKQQKKYLLDYTKKQKKYILDFKKQQQKHLLDLKKDAISDKKKDKLHIPKDPKYNYYDSYLYPQQVFPIPLPPHLPDYGIQTYHPKQDSVPQIPYNGIHPYDKSENDYSSNQFPYGQNENGYPNNLPPSYQIPVDINYPTNGLDDLNPQYTDPFHSWTSPNYPEYDSHNDFYQTRNSFNRKEETNDLERGVCIQYASINKYYKDWFLNFG